MKGTIEFFMTIEECTHFLEKHRNLFDRIDTNSAFSKLWIGTNFIQFLPASVFGNQLAAGRLAFMTQDETDKRAGVIFKKLKSELKKELDNHMELFTEIGDVKSTSRSFYFSQRAHAWLMENGNNKFVQFKDGAVEFVPMNVQNNS